MPFGRRLFGSVLLGGGAGCVNLRTVQAPLRHGGVPVRYCRAYSNATQNAKIVENVVEQGSKDESEADGRKFANIGAVSAQGTTKKWYKNASVEVVLPSRSEHKQRTEEQKKLLDRLMTIQAAVLSETVDNSASNEKLDPLTQIYSSKNSTKQEILQAAMDSGPAAGIQFRILLDGRAVRTPGDNRLYTPSLPLSSAICAEWEAQDEFIRPYRMPLMTLATTVLDHIPHMRDIIIGSVLQHLQTDTVCFRALHSEQPELFERQQKLHGDLIEKFQERFRVRLNTTGGGRLDNPEHPEETIQRIRWLLHTLTDWELEGVFALATSGRSTVIALALLYYDISVQDAFEAARLEEEFQIQRGGHVYGGHDLEAVDTRIKFLSAAVFSHLIRRPSLK